MKVKKPYLVDTENCSSFYETLEQAKENFYTWLEFYKLNIGKYGERTIVLKKDKKILLFEKI